MAQKLDAPRVDQQVVAVAARQHGVIARRQLTALGLQDREIGRRVRASRLHRVHRGVYAVGHPRLTTNGRFLAAVFAYGEGAVLSHRSAAVLWRLVRERGSRIDVTVPAGGGRARRRAIVVHRSRLPGEHVTVRDTIPVTTPVRTLIDLADVLPQRGLERAIDEAAYLRLDLDRLRPLAGRRGAGLIARVLAEHEAGGTRTRSDLEELMLALCRRFGLPQPRFNAIVEGYEVDCLWEAQRLIVETDGWAAHGTRGAFERDRWRDLHLATADWNVIRITWRRLEREPEQVAARLRRLLAT